ncbi:hypothetical protein TIFTF001_033560 [Ficus carica]|uniref:Uncharacterized protein n=1 Tax=Ficus carica TaxID=3494 RepID=A0AA88DZG2_FICCA|nr:hypothetical protein TIFTF001_033560 [Ficus carica]
MDSNSMASLSHAEPTLRDSSSSIFSIYTETSLLTMSNPKVLNSVKLLNSLNRSSTPSWPTSISTGS